MDSKTIRITKIQGTGMYNLFIDNAVVKCGASLKQIINYLDEEERKNADKETNKRIG